MEHGSHHEHGGHDKHAGHSVAMFRDKFWITLALAIPTVIWGHMLEQAFGSRGPNELRAGARKNRSAPHA